MTTPDKFVEPSARNPGSAEAQRGPAFGLAAGAEPTAHTAEDMDGSYYAKDGKVWKSPVSTKNDDGTTSISLGFPVCMMHDAVGRDAAETVAALMNAGAKAAKVLSK